MATPRTFRHLVLTTLTHFALVAFAASGASAQPASKLGPLARAQSARPTGWSQVIIRITPGTGSLLSSLLEQLGARAGRDLPLINGRVALVPNAALAGLAHNPFVEQVALDRPIEGTMERTGATIGATAVRQTYGYDGTGIGVAIIDSGVYRRSRRSRTAGIGSASSWTSSTAIPRRTTTTGTARTSPASSRAAASTRMAGERASPPARTCSSSRRWTPRGRGGSAT